MGEPLVHVGTLKAYFVRLAEYGIPAQELLTKIELGNSSLEDFTRVPLQKFVKLQQMATTYTGDPAVHLRAGFSLPPTSLGALQFLAASRQNIRGAFQDICRYSQFISEYAYYELKESTPFCSFRKLLKVPEDLLTRDHAIFCLSAFYGALSRLTVTPWKPSEVRFRHPRALADAHISECFGCKVTYNCEVDEMILPTSVLELPLLSADRRLARTLERHILQQGARFSRSISESVTSSICRNLPHRILSLDEVASELHQSPRTLQRALARELTCYTELVDEFRKDLADYYVRVLGERAFHVSEKLGFSDPSTFSRAFKRWYGTSPGNAKKILS